MQLKNKALLKQIGNRLRKVREVLKLTPTQIAGTLEVRLSAYRKNEQGLNAPGLRTLETMLKRHGISLNWLLFNRGPMRVSDTQKSPSQSGDADTAEMLEAMSNDRRLHFEMLAHYHHLRESRENRSASPKTGNQE